MPETDTAFSPTLSAVRSVLSALLGNTVTSAERIGGGHNSQVFKVRCGEFEQYAAKHYFRHPTDKRDRIKVEYSALEFLWDNGIRSVPQPVAVDEEHQWAAYQWIEGSAIPDEGILNSEIDQAVEFLGKLYDLSRLELSRKRASNNLPAASEANFTLQDTVANIQLRLNRLKAIGPAENLADGNLDRNLAGDLQRFLSDEFDPLFEEVVGWCKNHHAQSGRSYAQELSLSERTLSPSDFSFHNALMINNGQIVFVDFEYFGWDDPAKTVSDFLLHPAMNLTKELKERFVTGMFSQFTEAGGLESRVATFYPLFGFKWCLIMLNEFLPAHLLRRNFAEAGVGGLEGRQATQLAKSKAMLDKVRNEYERFPY